MEEKKLVPKLRFPGFTEPWEQRKLGEIVKIERGGSPRPIDNYITTDADGLNWIKIGDAPEQGRYIVHAAEKIKSLGLSKTRQVEPGDLILSNSMSFGKPYIMGIHGCIHDGWLLIRNNQNIFDLKFLCNLLGTEQLHAQYRRLAAGSAVNNLNKELVSGTNVGVPSKAEQLKIGQFFESMDQYITLHQRKLEHLKLKKKSLLQKLFPKEGSVYPELRFPGFTDPWEQRKFRSLFQKNLERNDGQFPFNKTISISRMIYSESGNGASTESLDNYKVLRVGDIAFEGHENKDFKFGRFVMNDVGNGIMSPRFTVLRPLIDMELNFWKEYINYEPIMQKKLVYSTKKGTMMNELVVEDFLNQYVAVPSVQEQQKIGYLLKCMTDDITLHQRKLEHLQLLKKALLQQLFV